MSVKTGAGGPYSKKYVKVTQDELRHTIIPRAADYCAQKRAKYALTGKQYFECLRDAIRRLMRGEELPPI